MKYCDLTIENGLVTYVDDKNVEGIKAASNLYIPKEVCGFDDDVLFFLDWCDLDIEVDSENPYFSCIGNCLLSKDGSILFKAGKNADISKLTSLKTIRSDAFYNGSVEQGYRIFKVPEGVNSLDYRSFSMSAQSVKIILPKSVKKIGALSFFIHSENIEILFEGDPELEIGVFGTKAEAEDSNISVYKSMPPILYVKQENIKIKCKKGSNVAGYCKKYYLDVSFIDE